MRKSLTFWLCWLVLACSFLVGVHAAPPAPAPVRVLQVQGAINPATSGFIVDGIADAEAAGAQLVVIELDTPGGLDASMRAIIRRMLSSRVPIATYVAPAGARAASAGTFIVYASHIAAMSPASNLGAASPVSIGTAMPAEKDGGQPSSAGSSEKGGNTETLAAKATNDAAAYIRGLAQLRGRDAAFAEAAVREALSIPASEALKRNVVEYVAPTLESLLEQIDGRELRLDDGRVVKLATRGAAVERIAPDWRTRLLSLLADPQLAVILMMLGIYGLFFELMSPGAALPGVAGLICLLLGLYGLHMLPVNWAGVALLAFGLLMMIGEVFLPSFGALGVGGLLAFILGGLFMTGPDVSGYYELSVPFLIAVGLASVLVIIGAGTLALRTRRGRVLSGHEAMLNERGTVVGVEDGMVYAEIRGENWRVESTEPLRLGDRIQVTGTQGLTLEVRRTGGND